jgi:peptidoglycan/LPS O-acetylase OafA/YrhL
LIASALVVSTVAALVIYRFIEKPLTNWLRSILHDRSAASLAKPELVI